MFPNRAVEAVRGILWGVGICSLLFVGSYVHTKIKDSGRAEIQALWDKDRAKQAAALRTIQDKLAAAELTHQTKQQELSDALSQAQLDYLTDLRNRDAEFSRRLRESEGRAELYRRQAEGSPAEQARLAGHAAQLDRALEEGLRLVGELQATLGLRDQSLIVLGQQILTDRALLDEIPNETE